MMNIVISLNSKYIKAAKSMLFSLQKYEKEPIIVWLLNHSLSNHEVRRFKSFLRKYNIDLAVIPIGPSFFDDMPLVSENQFSIEMYYRIFIPWLLPEMVDRALWLDSDIIISGDIAQFYNLDLNERCIAACEDGRYINSVKCSDVFWQFCFNGCACLVVPNLLLYLFWRKCPEMKYALLKVKEVITQ